MRVLIVKTSSMGDVLHTLPALQDAVRQLPQVTFDWVVEEAFQDIPHWHPAVKTVIPVAWRRWRKDLPAAWRSRELSGFLQSLRHNVYDIVLDAQGLLKSAGIARFAHGLRIGLDWQSAREPIASLVYQKTIRVAKDLHAITRLRHLFAQALGYDIPSGDLDYGTVLTPFPSLNRSEPYVVFLHATTWASKHWPEKYWQELIGLARNRGVHVLLPWGTAEERVRAERLALAGASVLPKLSINEMAHILKQAQGCVAVDTGLGHVAAAVGVPTVSLYGPTHPGLTGALGACQKHLVTPKECSPCFKRECPLSPELIMPPCFARLHPEQVWDALEDLKS